MKKYTQKTSIVVAVLAMLTLLATPAVAGLMDLGTEDSANFSWKYEMNVDPSNPSLIDLDNNSSADWTVGSANNGSVSFLDIDGDTSPDVAQLTSTAAKDMSYLNSGVFATNPSINHTATTEVWPELNFSKTTGFTIEIRAKIISQVGDYAMAIFPSASDSIDCGVLTIGTSGQGWYGTNNTDALGSGTYDNTTDFHTFRIAFEGTNNQGSGKWFVWRDDVLVSSGDGIDANYSYADNLNRLYVGDGSGNYGGQSQVDYVRFTQGAFAPVPEPSTLALILSAIAGLVCIRRRK